MGAEKRSIERKSVDYVSVRDLTSLSDYNLIATQGYITDISTAGFLLVLSRKHLAREELKQNLNLDSIIEQDVALYLPQMNLDLDGRVIRAAYVGQGNFEVAIKFASDIPEYWKECVMDLLPKPGEME